MMKSLRMPTVSAIYPPNKGPISEPARLADANNPKAQPVRSIGDSEAITSSAQKVKTYAFDSMPL